MDNNTTERMMSSEPLKPLMSDDQFKRCKRAIDLLHEVQLEMRRERGYKDPLANEIFRVLSAAWTAAFPYRPEANFFKEKTS